MPRRFSRRSSSSLALFAAALGLALSAAEPAVKPTTHTVVMEAVKFQPAVLEVQAGDMVVWVNKDPFPHTVTSPSFDSKIIFADKAWRYVAKKRGDFPYACTLHPTMKGELRVK